MLGAVKPVHGCFCGNIVLPICASLARSLCTAFLHRLHSSLCSILWSKVFCQTPLVLDDF